MRTKDQVRRDVWRSMDREGVSRFPGAEGRIPNFAGAKLAAEKLAGQRPWRRARVIKARASMILASCAASRVCVVSVVARSLATAWRV